MSEISLTLTLQIKTSKIINDMAKVSKKSEKITAFGGIYFVSMTGGQVLNHPFQAILQRQLVNIYTSIPI